MADYISRNMLLMAFENADTDVCESYPDGYSKWGFSYTAVRGIIKNIPVEKALTEPVRRRNKGYRPSSKAADD